MRGLFAFFAGMAFVVSAGFAHAAQTPTAPAIDDTGIIRFAGLSFSVIHFDANWAMAGQRSDLKAEAGFPRRSKDTFELRGSFATRGGPAPMSFTQTVMGIDQPSFTYKASVTCAQPVPTNTLALLIDLPAERYGGQKVLVDGQAVALPQNFSAMSVLRRDRVKKLELPTATGRLTIEGEAGLYIQDDRQFGSSQFAVRISFNPGSGNITSASLELKISHVADASMRLPPEEPLILKADETWRPMTHTLEIQPEGVLDFSFLLDAPAGKHGHLTVNGAHFEFDKRPGKPVRFYGTNLCFSANFPSREDAERIAAHLARAGYNCVRLHHYDYDLTDKKAADSTTLDAAQLDRLEYFIHCLKQKGIYINIDLYTFRQTRAHEIPELNRPVRDGYKALVPLLDSAMRNWQTFARNFLTHRNPYTQMTLAEDPVLVGICPLNEDPLSVNYNAAPDIRKLYDQRFEQWLKERNISATDDAQRRRLLARFLGELQIDGNRRTFAFLKQLGVKAPLTSVNCLDSMALTPVRAELEYVDNHAYWDHPGFPERPWSLPFRYRNQSAVAAGATVPRHMIPTRIAGKPFTTTEVNYCPPNRYRAESGPLLGAYAALQDWDGVFRFAHSHNIRNLQAPSAMNGFDAAADPISLLADRIAMLLFVRGDVSPGKRMVPFLVSDDTAYTAPMGWGQGYFPEAFQYLGLYTRVGSMHVDGPHPPVETFDIVVGQTTLNPKYYKNVRFAPGESSLIEAMLANRVVPPGAIDLAARKVVSDTGEITLDGSAGTFQVVTERTECFVIPDDRAVNGKAVSVSSKGGFAVVSVSSMDGRPIASSSRLLVVHLTDVQNTGTRYRNRTMTILEQWGSLPHLVRRATAQVTIAQAQQDAVRAWALDVGGKRVSEVEITRAPDGRIVFTADTSRGSLAYEITR